MLQSTTVYSKYLSEKGINMPEKNTAEMLAYIGQNLQRIQLLEEHGVYYEIAEHYLGDLTTDEFEAALELAVAIKKQERFTPSLTSINTEQHIDGPISHNLALSPIVETSQPDNPEPHHQLIKERTTILQEDRDKIDQLRQLGYTPVEIAKLVKAKSNGWAKNIIYAHSATSSVAELDNLRKLDLGNLPFNPAHAKSVQRRLQASTLSQKSKNVESVQKPKSNPDPEEPA